MKYINSLLFLIAIGFIIVSCDRFEPVGEYTDENFYRFESQSSNIAENTPAPASIPVIYSSTDGASATGSVSFTIDGGVAGTDYTIVNANNTLTFNEANGFTDYIEILPVDDDIERDSNLVLEIRLTNGSNGIVGFPGPDNAGSDYVHTLTILDDDCTIIPIGGEYNSIGSMASLQDIDPASISGHPATVTITPLGNNRFRINDFTAGLYLELYDVFGITSQDDSPAIIEVDPFSGDVMFVAGSLEPFGYAIFSTGSYDQCTGEIQYQWETPDLGDEGAVFLTPK